MGRLYKLSAWWIRLGITTEHIEPAHPEAERWKSAWVNCNHVLAGEYVGFDEVEEGIWAMYYGPLLLGRFHECDLVIIGNDNRNRLKNPRPGLVPMSPV